MPDGVKDILELGEPQAGSSAQEAAEFKQKFQERLQQMNDALQYTAANADAKGHGEQTGKRDKLIAAYQAVLGKFNGDAAAAKAGADKVLSASQGTSGEIVKYREQVQQQCEQWQAKQPNYDEAVAKIDEMENWGDEKAGQLRSIASKIQQQADQKQYKPAVQAVDQFAEKLKPIYEKAKQNSELKQQYEQQLPTIEPQISQAPEPAGQKSAKVKQELDGLQSQMAQAVGSRNYEQAVQLLNNIKSKAGEYKQVHSQEVTQGGGVTRTETTGEVAASVESGSGYDPKTGKTVDGIAVKGHATAKSVKKEGGPVTGEVKIGHAEGEFKVGEHVDPSTGAKFKGVKASGKAVLAEVNADTPIGKVEGAFGKAEAEGVVGYEYDPESKTTFAGAKGKASVAAFEGKVKGKFGKLEGKTLSACVESKTGVECNDKTGKLFVGTTNKAEASVAEIAGELKTPDDSVKLVGEAQFLKAEATLDANAVVDKYGIDLNAKAGAEANIYKVGIGGEVRATPKALFDNTVGALLDVKAPDWADFGPVFGAKVSEGKGIGGTVEGGMRLGVDEINARAGGFIELGEGVGLDVKSGFRLGPLKYAVDNWDDIKQGASDAKDWASEKASDAKDWASEKASDAKDWASEKSDQAGEAYDKAKDWAGEQASDAKDWATEKAERAKDWAQEKAEEAEQGYDKAKDWAAEQATDAKDWATEKASAAKDWASDKASGAVDTVTSTGNWLKNKATSTWDSIFG